MKSPRRAMTKQGGRRSAGAAQPDHPPSRSEVRAHPGVTGPLQPSSTGFIQEVKHRGFFHQLSTSREECDPPAPLPPSLTGDIPQPQLHVSSSVSLPI